MNKRIVGITGFLFVIGILAMDANAQKTLKEACGGSFLIGAALNQNQFNGQDERGAALVREQFNTITPENILKWEHVHPQPDTYNFEPADQYVAFGETNGMFIIGHTLIWHSQAPKWVFTDTNGVTLGREALLARMKDHISTVVGRYKGRIRGWDVVNEALNEDGTMRQSQWMKIIGEDYVIKAFEYAHEADPGAELYYNDYSLENKAKRKGAVTLIKKLQAAGVPVMLVGLQGHYKMEWPSTRQIRATIKDFEKIGINVAITELDMDVLPAPGKNRGAEVSLSYAQQAKLNPYTNGFPASMEKKLAKRYGKVFEVFTEYHENIARVTFWGVADADSWLNNWPIRGRTSYPLLFDRDHQPKPAFDAVVKASHW